MYRVINPINLSIKSSFIEAEWFIANKLSVNLSKTNYILFRSHRKVVSMSDLKLEIDDKEIMQVTSSKFLGVYIDQHLTWVEHISHISKKIAKNISILSRIRHQVHLTRIVLPLTFPYLSYCSISWGCNYTSKRALRIVHMLPWFASTKPVFKIYNILHHENITKYQFRLFMYCYHYKLFPSNFDNYFCQGISIHKYNTRYSCHYRSYPARTKVMQFSVKCSGPKFWNTFPQELIQAPTLSLFKTKMKHYLLSSQL